MRGAALLGAEVGRLRRLAVVRVTAGGAGRREGAGWAVCGRARWAAQSPSGLQGYRVRREVTAKLGVACGGLKQHLWPRTRPLLISVGAGRLPSL